jgi:hypothetical protein
MVLEVAQAVIHQFLKHLHAIQQVIGSTTIGAMVKIITIVIIFTIAPIVVEPIARIKPSGSVARVLTGKLSSL